MKRLGFGAALAWLAAGMLSAQTPAPQRAPAPGKAPAKPAATMPAAPQTFEKYCFECHNNKSAEARISLEHLVAQPSVGPQSGDWERVLGMLDEGLMPPSDATAFPTDAERKAAADWVRSSLRKYETAHAGEPGRVTVRRMTSGEYGYAIRDLTGIDIKVGIDMSSDAVGGEGFANFGDVQFVQDASIERYLEAAKAVADHAVIGAGPLEFYADPGKTGRELSALNRINELYAAKGFRVVSGEGGRPFGLERYGKALYVAWHYRHRAALGDPAATIRGLAAKEGITGRFADHIWAVVNTPKPGYPTSETLDRWKKLPAPTADAKASIAAARAGCDEIYKTLTTWPSWFFARGDYAAGGAGDESPLVFDDTTLKAQPARRFNYGIGGAGGRGGLRARGPAPGGPTKVFLTFANLNPATKAVVIWRNAQIVTRGPAAGRGRGAPGLPAVAQGAQAGRGGGGPILSTQPLKALLSAAEAATLGFGTSPDAATLGPDDFATSGTVSFTIDVPAGGNALPPGGGTAIELQIDAELGASKDAVVRLAISDRADGSSRDAAQRVVLGDMKSAGYKTFRAGMAEYVASLPPNSHGEANPADKDPVPPPFDNTYNSPEHDAFVMNVKYQRSDKFFTDNMVDGPDRARLNQAWNDLFGSWPYHDAYLGMLIDHFSLKLKSRTIVNLDAAAIAAQPAAVQPHLTALRAHYDQVMKTERLAEPGHVADALAFASRAWRRPLALAEKANLQGFYQRQRTNGLDHEGALRALIARILVSPNFIYRVEQTGGLPPVAASAASAQRRGLPPVAASAASAQRRGERALNGYELASRMSFFLWSSVPDAELRRAAAAGELGNPDLLAKQVRRMTADPKARRLATEFFGQWLGFYRFDEYRGIDTSRFPEFTDEVKTAMYDEAVSAFEYLVRENRPVRDILYADYTFLNQPLAKFYGIEKDLKLTNKVVKVDDAGALNRGGVLRMGSFLTTTSAPLRTSPVKRGDWILRRILGTPTPPPPADAGNIPGDDKSFNGLTLRERLNQHKRNATCANCHLRIDPLGFPLEGYDAVGRARATYADGKPVDVTGEFADKTTIVGTSGLLKYLQAKDKEVLTTLSRKMLGYALGRTVMASDRPLINQMLAGGAGATVSDLALKIINSRQFRNHTGDDQ